MKASEMHRHMRKQGINLSMKVKKNPVMLLGVSLPFIIATAISLKSAAVMSVEMLTINLITALAAALTARWLAFWKRAVVYVGVATVTMMLTRALITRLLPEVADTMGTYIYLMALNGMVPLHAELSRRADLSEDKELRAAEKQAAVGTVSLGGWLRNALVHALVFAVMMFAVSLPREYFGSGTLWGRPVPIPFRMPGMLLPFFGFIGVGFLLAAIKFIAKRITIYRIAEAARRQARDDARYTEIHIEP